MPGVEEALDVVRMRDPGRRRIWAGELQARRCLVVRRRFWNKSAAKTPAIELRSETLVRPVVHPVTLTVEVTELTARSLTIQVLIGRQDRRLVPGVRRADFRARTVAARCALLGRDNDHAVGRARAVEC